MDFDDDGVIDPSDMGFDDEERASTGVKYLGLHLNSPLDDDYVRPIEKFRHKNPSLNHYKHDTEPQRMIAKVHRWAMSCRASIEPIETPWSHEKVMAETLLATGFLGSAAELPKVEHSKLTNSLRGLSEALERSTMRAARPTQAGYRTSIGDLQLETARGYWQVSLDGFSSILSHDLLLMLKDVVCSRALILEALEVRNSLESPLQLTPDYLSALWGWGDSLIEDYGTPAFDLIKSFESLAVGRLIVVTTHVNDVAGGPEFEQTMRTGFLQDANERGISGASRVFQLIDELSDPDSINELAGLYKTWGHPCVDVPAGIKANRKVAEAEKPPPDPSAVNNMVLLFRKLFVDEYYKKHSRHPECDLSKMAQGNPVRESISAKRPVPKNTKLSDYEGLEFLKTFDVDTVSSMDIVHDKALGPTLSELKLCIKLRAKNDIQDRRTLLNYLRHDYPALITILRDLDERGIDDEYLTLGVTPKERELKTKARLFSLIPMILKFYFGGTEKLIADHILPYFPQITMKDDQRDLTEKVLGMTSSGNDLEILPVSLHIDFEKWNMNFRHAMAQPTFADIDKLFGFTQLISMTHLVFQRIQYHCHDGRHWADLDAEGNIVQGTFAWLGQYGGVEGLRQKGWTVLTILIILLATGGSEASFRLTGQGDNQVLCAKYSLPRPGGLSKQSPEVLARIRADVESWVQELYSVAAKVGMPIKPSESWSSSSLYSYGKNTFHHGRPLSAALKRLSRAFLTTNDLHPSLYSSIVAIGANAQSAAYQSQSPLLAYVIGTRQVERSLRLHLEYHPGVESGVMYLPGSVFHGFRTPSMRTEQVVKACLYGAAVVGGYPVVHLYAFLALGGPDQLSDYLSWMLRLQSRNPRLQTLLDNWCSPVDNPKLADLKMLFQDPSSGNFLSGTLATNLVKRTVNEWFKSGVVKNRVVRSLLDVREMDDEPLIIALSSMKPLNPLLGSYLISVTPAEFADEFVGRFDNASSVRLLATALSGDFDYKMSVLETNFLSAVLIQSTTKRLERLPECPTLRAQQLRCRSWGRDDIVGVTSPALTSLLELCPAGCPPDFSIVLDEVRPTELFRCRGNRPPYTGSRGERVVQQHNDYTSVEPEKILRRLIKAQQVLRAILPPTDPAVCWLGKLWSSVTDLEYLSLSPKESALLSSPLSLMRQLLTTGGSLAHHFTVSTHSWSVISPSGALKKGSMLSKNTHTPTLILSINALIAIRASLRMSINPRLEFIVKCGDCVLPPLSTFSGPESLRQLAPTSMVGVEGVWTSKEGILPHLVRTRVGVGSQEVELVNSREQQLSLVGYLSASILTGKDTSSNLSELGTEWVTPDEYYQSVFSWVGALVFSPAVIESRENWVTKQDWDREIRRLLGRVPTSGFDKLVKALEESGGLWDVQVSRNSLLPLSSEDQEERSSYLRSELLKQVSAPMELIEDQSFMGLLLRQLSFSCWGPTGSLRLRTRTLLQRAQEVVNYCREVKSSISSLTIASAPSEVPVHWLDEANQELIRLARRPVLSPLIPFGLPRLSARLLDPINRGPGVEPLSTMLEIDVSTTVLDHRRELKTLLDDSPVDFTLTKSGDTESETLKVLQGLVARYGNRRLVVAGWGCLPIAGWMWRSGFDLAGCAEFWPYEDTPRPYPVIRGRAKHQVSTLGDMVLWVLPRVWSQRRLLDEISTVLWMGASTVVLWIPWQYCKCTGAFLTLVRRYYPRFRVLGGVSDECISRFLVVAEGPPLKAETSMDLVFLPRLYPDWQSSLRSGGLIDWHRRPEGGRDELESYLGPHVGDTPEEIWSSFLDRALEGVDLSKHFPEARLKRYRGPGTTPLDMRDLATVALAVADAVGVITPPSSHLVITFRGPRAHLRVMDVSGVASYPMHSGLKASGRYSRIVSSVKHVLQQHETPTPDSPPYAPASPAYYPTSPVVEYVSDDDWGGRGAAYILKQHETLAPDSPSYAPVLPADYPTSPVVDYISDDDWSGHGASYGD